MKKFILVFFSLLLTACAAATHAPSATSKATVAATPERVSTPTLSDATATPSVTEAPTITPKPSDTTIPSETVDLTQKAYSEASETQAAKIAVFHEPASCYENFISPNGEWLAAECAIEGHKLSNNIEVFNKTGQHWVIESEQYEYYGLSPEHWSADGAYLYFASRVQGSGGGYDCMYVFAEGLYRLNLNDGSVSTIVQGPVTFSFSPTGRRLAYEDWPNLIIRDLKTGDEIKSNHEEDGSIGTLTWSPDGLELAYATCQENDPGSVADGIPKKSAIKIFSIRQNASRTILTIDKRLLSIEAWNADHTLTISSEGGMQGEGTHLFDLKTSQWMTVTPEP